MIQGRFQEVGSSTRTAKCQQARPAELTELGMEWVELDESHRAIVGLVGSVETTLSSLKVPPRSDC